MKIKGSKTKYINKDRMIEAGIICLGTMLITSIAICDNQNEKKETNLSSMDYSTWHTRNHFDVLRSYEKESEYIREDLFHEDYVSIGEQLMMGIYPIGEKLEVSGCASIYSLEDLNKSFKPMYSSSNIEQSNGGVVYLDEKGNKVVADTDYKIIECNGMGYQHFGYLLLNENSQNKWDYEGVYKKEDVSLKQHLYPVIDDTFSLSSDGEFVKSGYIVTYLDEEGNVRQSFYNNNGELISDSLDKEQGHTR